MLDAAGVEVPIVQVDTFADQQFSGNPAAVCPLLSWLPDECMQSIAAENNLSETAFVVPVFERYRLRWFTPRVEVDLCGHATLAAGHVVMTRLQPDRQEVVFDTRSGPLTVRREETSLRMDLPSCGFEAQAPDPRVVEALGGEAPVESYQVARQHGADCWMFAYDSAAQVAALQPRFGEMNANVIVTADATGFDAKFDFVSRFFAPASGIDEDPVTGSAHCALTPYWARRLGKRKLLARQLSRRGGTLGCTDQGERIQLTGSCVDYLQGSILLP